MEKEGKDEINLDFITSNKVQDMDSDLNSRKLIPLPYGNEYIYIFKNNITKKENTYHWYVFKCPIPKTKSLAQWTYSKYVYQAVRTTDDNMEFWVYVLNTQFSDHEYSLIAHVLNQYLFNGMADYTCLFHDQIAYAPSVTEFKSGKTSNIEAKNKNVIEINFNRIKELAAKWKKERLEIYPNLNFFY